MHKSVLSGKKNEKEWNKITESYKKKYPELYRKFVQYFKQSLPGGWDKSFPIYKPEDGQKATRSVSADVINAVEARIPWLMGGSADLEPSTETMIKSSSYFSAKNYVGRNIAWGVREHNMCAASSGMMLHGGIRPFAATFFIFTDYARPAIRLACIMKLPVIYVMTHDSIGLGEDGTTHQPIEHLASFRAMPGMCIIRPADANEAAYAWSAAIQRMEGPTMLVLTRQKLPILDANKYNVHHLIKGAYIISSEKRKKPDVILMGTGSEVHLLLEAQEKLFLKRIDARVVSMPSWELFMQQRASYRDSVIPPQIKKRVAVEAAATFGWRQWVGDEGRIIGMDTFGASAPEADLFKHYGITTANIVNTVMQMLKK
jgi:transketolase